MSLTDTNPSWGWLDDLLCTEMWNLKCSSILSGVSVCEDGDCLGKAGMSLHRGRLTLKRLCFQAGSSTAEIYGLLLLRNKKPNNLEMHWCKINLKAPSLWTSMRIIKQNGLIKLIIFGLKLAKAKILLLNLLFFYVKTVKNQYFF